MTNLLEKQAKIYAMFDVDIEYLESIRNERSLNREQCDYIDGFINHIADECENFDMILYDAGEDYRWEVVQLSNELIPTLKPEQEFIEHVEKYLNMYA